MLVDHSIALNNIFTKTIGMVLLFVLYQQGWYNKTEISHYISHGDIHFLKHVFKMKTKEPYKSRVSSTVYLYI